MPITLTIDGSRVKVENGKVEAAFRQAIGEVVERAVLASIANPSVSKIAAELGLAETVWVEAGNGATNKRTAFPAAILDRVAAILGCDDLAGTFRHDPAEVAREEEDRRRAEAEEAREQAEWIAERERVGHRHEVVFVSGAIGAAPWLARIVGADPKYRFAREFEASTGTHKKNVVWHLIRDGIYQVGFSGNAGGSGYFFELAGGVERQLGRAEVEAAFPLA